MAAVATRSTRRVRMVFIETGGVRLQLPWATVIKKKKKKGIAAIAEDWRGCRGRHQRHVEARADRARRLAQEQEHGRRIVAQHPLQQRAPARARRRCARRAAGRAPRRRPCSRCSERGRRQASATSVDAVERVARPSRRGTRRIAGPRCCSTAPGIASIRMSTPISISCRCSSRPIRSKRMSVEDQAGEAEARRRVAAGAMRIGGMRRPWASSRRGSAGS